MTMQQNGRAVFRVVDAMDAPHGGRILRLRLQDGAAPSIRSLKGARLRAVSPAGVERHVNVEGFPLFGGRPSDARLARTGRVDVHVRDDDEGAPVALRWEVRVAG
jgi:hypothetical protein